MAPPVAGYYDWWDAPDAATIAISSGTNVSTWTSKGSHAAVLTNAGGTINTGTRTLNSLNVLDFEGSVNSRFSTLSYAAQPLTVFFVFARDTGDVGSLMDGTGATRNFLAISGTAYDIYAGTEQTWGTIDTSPHYRSAVFNGASSADYIDGTLGFSGNVGAQNLDTLWIGRGGTNFNGYMGEIIIYNSALSDGDRQSVESYLNTRWFVAAGGGQPVPIISRF